MQALIIIFIILIVVRTFISEKQMRKKRISVSSEDQSKYNQILELLESGHNVFITGGAGTGKSYTLAQLKKHYQERLHLTSTTGISAINIKGQTIHSWAGIGTATRPIHQTVAQIKKNAPLYKQILLCQMLAIDEISMLRSDVMNYLDQTFKFVRSCDKPFGGIQVIFIGDFFQLPPIPRNAETLKAQDFCFCSHAWQDAGLKIVLLDKVKRQTDLEFVRVLNNIRQGKTSAEDLRLLWEREESVRKEAYNDKDKLHLFAVNEKAESHNKLCLDAIDKPSFVFDAEDRLDWCDTDGEVLRTEKVEDDFYLQPEGITFEKDCRIPRRLELKKGCRVMLLKNLDIKAELANGSCGRVVKLKDDYIEVDFDCGIKKVICLDEFESCKTQQDKATGATVKKIIRKQYPLRLAYGITIHKSQGMTFDELVVSCDRIFADGQAYVALSRTRTLKGLYPQSFDPNKVTVNDAVVDFYNSLLSSPRSGVEGIDRLFEKKNIIHQAIVQKKKLKVVYQANPDFKGGKITERVIIPKELNFGSFFNKNQDEEHLLNGNTLYLRAFCTLRNETRTFMVDRIVSVQIVD